MDKEQSVEQLEVEKWRMKKMLKKLQNARGNGTSMISLILPPKDQISRANKLLMEEYGTASNIKSRVNRLSVLGAITSAQQRLKLITRVPDNGLAIYTGTIISDDGKEKKICIDVEPIRPINTSLYLCDSRFHVDDLLNAMDDNFKFGFIVVNGSGALFAVLSGNSKEIKQQISVELPKKHGRGGQSSVRFARLRVEKRHNYLRKVAEIATQIYITNNKPNVNALILAGNADFKTDLAQSDMFDQRLKSIVAKIVDVAYGGENGLNQAIEQCEEVLQSLKLVSEKKAIKVFFEEVMAGSGKVCYGAEETMNCLESGSVDTFIIDETSEVKRCEIDGKITYSTSGDGELLTDWLAENCRSFSCTIMLISDKTQEGTQFISTFGGIGAVLRYKMDTDAFQSDIEDFSDADIFES
ncbi:peptide chain release factor subunit 1 [Nematocida sp. LUAm3]|nr:peptide chain release factor subunit 1 [Nematocida sp. LUAm3]KAI5173688.1 peptide chain release factor subunit 1 [Nematocida sp. LUAm2]KAI5176909.1 peptide chain release factor subunit 1 [Nematocida sp. LUAm1]